MARAIDWPRAVRSRRTCCHHGSSGVPIRGIRQLARLAGEGDRRPAPMVERTQMLEGDVGAAPRPRARSARRGQARHRLRRRVLARQVRTDQRDLLRRVRQARAAVVRRAYDDVPDRTAVRRDVAALHPRAADRDPRPGRIHVRLQAARPRVEGVPGRHDVAGRNARRLPDGRRNRPRVPSTRHAARAVRSGRSRPGHRHRRRAAWSRFRSGAMPSSISRIRC